MQLSKRLECAASFVKKGSVVADIGCDHAYMSIYLVKNNISPFVYAADINDGPLEIAKNNINLYGQSTSIQVIKSDGLKNFDHSIHLDTVLICGMGGSLICDILKGEYITDNKVNELVLSPQSDVFRVRHFLHDNGYTIDDEKMIFEDGKYYTIIHGIKGNEKYDNEYEYIYGQKLIQNKDTVLKSFLDGKLSKNRQILKRFENEPVKTDIIAGRTREITDEIKVIESCLNLFN